MRRLAATAAALALLVAAGCSDDADDTIADNASGGVTASPAPEAGETEDEAEGFDVLLTGEAEVPGPGDEDGTGTANVILGDGEVCTEIDVVLEMPPLAAHIHEGTVEESGPVVIGFEEPTREDGWSTCVEADQALLDEIAADPAGYYLNVHNEDFPDGAVRAQLG